MRSLLINIALLAITVVAHFFIIPSEERHFNIAETAPIIILKKDIYAHKIFDALTPEQKAGQRLFISIPGGISNESLRELLSVVHPGGVIFFSQNITSATRTRELTSTLQTIAKELGDPPLFIAVDEEGGVVERIWFDPVKYSALELGNFNDDELSKETSENTTKTLTDLGFNVNFAPVSDVAYDISSVMYNRSFGSNPDIVAHQVSISVSTLLKNGIMPTAKHFPGHGRSKADSHYALPTIPISKEEWLETDAKPFIAAIEEDIPFIMSGHLLFPSIDSEPASSSAVWLMQILREELGYNGIIVSDDIKMGAYNQAFSTTTLQFLDAGNDMIIAAVDLESLHEIQVTAKLAQTEEKSVQIEKKSLLRILRTKYALLLQDEQ